MSRIKICEFGNLYTNGWKTVKLNKSLGFYFFFNVIDWSERT